MLELKTQLLQNIRSCLFHLLPRGTFRGDKFYVGDVQGNKGKSTVIELTGERAGLWKDFATGEGGDIIDLWATVHGKNARIEFPEVMLSISEWLGKTNFKEQRNLEQYLTCSWNYYDENNQLIVIVYRYDPPLEKKQFKPFDVKKQRFKEPEIRPLYNIPGILKSDKVVLVEGEKCAEALIEKGITATTAMFGANAPIDKTDWTPLKGKHIIIWPDNDEAGNKYTKNAEKRLLDLGVASLATLKIPPNKPKSWDAADCVLEGINIEEFIEKNSRKIIIKPPLDIFSWSVERFVGPVPKQRFLVEGLFPLGVTSILAAMGDTGKGMLLLDLALKVAGSIDQVCGFGPLVTEHGSVVVFSAEDDTNEIHRRLERLDPKCERLKYKGRLFIVPLPNIGGSLTILKNVRGKVVEISPEFESVMKQLSRIKDLKLIIFDPLASFIHADLNADPAVGDYLMCLLSDLACSTGDTVFIVNKLFSYKTTKNLSAFSIN